MHSITGAQRVVSVLSWMFTTDYDKGSFMENGSYLAHQEIPCCYKIERFATVFSMTIYC